VSLSLGPARRPGPLPAWLLQRNRPGA
jgi:hypothetical protein